MLLRKITELVDTNIADRAGKISILGMAIPLVPFMFVDGAPIERFPKLAALSFVASITWLIFVTWRGVLYYIRSRLSDED